MRPASEELSPQTKATALAVEVHTYMMVVDTLTGLNTAHKSADLLHRLFEVAERALTKINSARREYDQHE